VKKLLTVIFGAFMSIYAKIFRKQVYDDEISLFLVLVLYYQDCGDFKGNLEEHTWMWKGLVGRGGA